jgi:hypothetical protein
MSTTCILQHAVVCWVTTDNASTGDVIDLDAQGPCLGNPVGKVLTASGRKHRTPGHMATMADIAR